MTMLIENAKILVVDDSGMILQVVSLMLQSHGFKGIECVNSLKAALSKVDGFTIPYDLIILDRYIGEDSGLEVLKAVRQRNNSLPVIMLTQEKEGGKIIEAISDGASDYIVKPFSEDVLLSKIKKALHIV